MSMSQDEKRLHELYSYQLLHTQSEPELKMIVKHVARRFGMPIALLSLVDKERQWFMATHGFDVDETSRAISFCDYVVRTKKPMMVEDAREDERFVSNPMVTDGLKIKSYVGAPLTTQNGFVLGALCMIDNEHTRKFTQSEVELLEVFARCVMSHFEVRHAMAIAERELAHDHPNREDRSPEHAPSSKRGLADIARDLREGVRAIESDCQHIASRVDHDISLDLEIIRSSNEAVTSRLDSLAAHLDDT